MSDTATKETVDRWYAAADSIVSRYSVAASTDAMRAHWDAMRADIQQLAEEEYKAGAISLSERVIAQLAPELMKVPGHWRAYYAASADKAGLHQFAAAIRAGTEP